MRYFIENADYTGNEPILYDENALTEYSFSEPKTKVYLMISPKNDGLFDLFDEEITDIADLDGRPYTTAYLSTEEKSELYKLKELIKEKLKTVDIVQVIPRN